MLFFLACTSSFSYLPQITAIEQAEYHDSFSIVTPDSQPVQDTGDPVQHDSRGVQDSEQVDSQPTDPCSTPGYWIEIDATQILTDLPGQYGGTLTGYAAVCGLSCGAWWATWTAPAIGDSIEGSANWYLELLDPGSPTVTECTIETNAGNVTIEIAWYGE
jgi:hypothetical protein